MDSSVRQKWSRPAASARVMVSCGALAAWLIAAGCAAPDQRISVAEMQAREQAVVPAEPVAVTQEELGLTDFHPYQVGAGDVLEIRMTGLREDPYAETGLIARVHEDGTISLPVVGRIEVQGRELGAVEEAIIAAHVPDVVRDLAVFVQLTGPENTTVLVQGAASAPGLVRLPQNERNLLYALAEAGGFGSQSTGRVWLKPIRPERQDVLYDLNDVNDLRRALLGPPLEPGDVLLVETAENSAIYISGLVNRPGPIMIPPQSTLSVVRAISAAGGLREYIDVKEATLVREMPDGEQVHVKLDLGDMLKGRAPDLALKPGDVLQLPHTLDTFTQEWFFRNVLVGPFSVGVRYDPLAQYNANRAIEADEGLGGNASLTSSIRTSLATSIPSLVVSPPPQP